MRMSPLTNVLPIIDREYCNLVTNQEAIDRKYHHRLTFEAAPGKILVLRMKDDFTIEVKMVDE